MAGAVIGALRVVLGIDTAAFEDGLANAQKRLGAVGKNLSRIGEDMRSVGRTLTLGVSAPIAAAGAGIIKMAGDFQASMNKVGISTQASAADMKEMSALALKLGKDTTFSASTAADAMDMLAKNGLTAKDILGGAATAALNLAAAAGSELDPAAAAITDTLQQFKMTTADLPTIVNQITGAVNQSKLDFVDFQGAAAQAGGVAANVGVKFKDFTAVLAGISPLFASGSDAGTSFKTFLTSLGNPSTKAAEEIKRLGLSFYTASGQLRPMAEIAEQLRQKLGGLSDQAKTQSLATIFGADGIRTALGLMALGSQGLDDIKAKIAATDAAAQSAERLKGFNGQLEQLKGSVETLAIAIGNSGMLETMTGLVAGAADLIGKMSELSPGVLQAGTVIAGLAAVVGPIVIALGAMANAIGVLIPVFTGIASVVSTVVIPIIIALSRALMGMMVAGGPLTLLAAALAAVYVAWQNWDSIRPILINLYNGVKTWLVDKLGGVWDWLQGKIKAVGDWFFQLYDRVVGHSYVPDMVDEIGDHMGRLDTNMVQPAKKATDAAAQAFQALQSRVSGILDRIFPDQARFNQLKADLDDLAAYAKKVNWTPQQTDEALQRLRFEAGGVDPSKRSAIDVPTPERMNLPDLSKATEDMAGKIKAANKETVESFTGMARDVAGSLGNLVRNIKSGNWLSALSGVLDLIGQVAGLIRGTGSPGIRTYPTTPGFATGGSFVVNGVRGIDQNLLSMNGRPIARVSHGETVAVGHGGGGGAVEIVPSPWFEVRARSASAPDVQAMGAQAAAGGARMAAADAARRQRRRLG